MPATLGCHTQGVAVDPSTGSVVITCEDLTVLWAKGRIGLWPTLADNARAVKVKADTGNRGYEFHPSSTQLLEGVVPVFFAAPLPAMASTLRFYRVEGARLRGPVGQTVVHEEGHMGAVAFAKVGGSYVLVACGWDCGDLGVWTSAEGPTQGFARSFYPHDTGSIASGGVDQHVGGYNSLYLTAHCGTGQPLLFGTHGSTLDVWEVSGILTSEVRMTKIHSRTLQDQPDIFKEGFTMLPNSDGSDAEVYAVPHDFTSWGCPNNRKCTESLHVCHFAAA